MQTVREVITRIEYLYNKGIASDDSRLRPRHVYNVIKSKSSKVLEERLNKLQKVGDYLFTPIPCVPLIQVSAHDCACLGLAGCTLWRTKCKLPQPITSRANHMIESVTSIEGLIRFEETTWQHRKYVSYEKYTHSAPRYFLHGEYLYVINNTSPTDSSKFIEFITIRGLWFDPIEAVRQCNFCNPEEPEDCTPILDSSFNVIGKDLERVIELSVIELVDIFNRSKDDRKSEGQDRE